MQEGTSPVTQCPPVTAPGRLEGRGTVVFSDMRDLPSLLAR